MVASAGHEGRGSGFDTQRVQNTKAEVLCTFLMPMKAPERELAKHRWESRSSGNTENLSAIKTEESAGGRGEDTRVHGLFRMPLRG